jgi:hypothetical protein
MSSPATALMRLPAYQVVVTQELKDYFAEMKAKHGITLDAEQMAWYTKMFAEQHGPDDMKSEYPSCIEECFHNSLQGSYFKRELRRHATRSGSGCRCPTIRAGR